MSVGTARVYLHGTDAPPSTQEVHYAASATPFGRRRQVRGLPTRRGVGHPASQGGRAPVAIAARLAGRDCGPMTDLRRNELRKALAKSRFRARSGESRGTHRARRAGILRIAGRVGRAATNHVGTGFASWTSRCSQLEISSASAPLGCRTTKMRFRSGKRRTTGGSRISSVRMAVGLATIARRAPTANGPCGTDQYPVGKLCGRMRRGGP